MGFRKGELAVQLCAFEIQKKKQSVVESLPCKFHNSLDHLNSVRSKIERLILNVELVALSCELELLYHEQDDERNHHKMY